MLGGVCTRTSLVSFFEQASSTPVVVFSVQSGSASAVPPVIDTWFCRVSPLRSCRAMRALKVIGAIFAPSSLSAPAWGMAFS